MIKCPNQRSPVPVDALLMIKFTRPVCRPSIVQVVQTVHLSVNPFCAEIGCESILLAKHEIRISGDTYESVSKSIKSKNKELRHRLQEH